jgi:hypothetical protein
MSKINDWPLIENTLYHNQRLINLLNMNAGDKKYVSDSDGMRSTGRWYNTHSIKSFADRELKNSIPIKYSKRKYYYNGLNTNIIVNYLVHKTDYNFQEFLDKIFQRKIKNQYTVRSRKNLFKRNDNGKMTNNKMNVKDGTSSYTFYATRYDYLRVAKAILDDWNNDTCVGKYLKKLAKIKSQRKDIWKKRKVTDFHLSHMQANFIWIIWIWKEEIFLD